MDFLFNLLVRSVKPVSNDPASHFRAETSILNAADLANYVGKLRVSLHKEPELWENLGVDSFIDGIQSVLESSSFYFLMTPGPAALGQPTWRHVAACLLETITTYVADAKQPVLRGSLSEIEIADDFIAFLNDLMLSPDEEDSGTLDQFLSRLEEVIRELPVDRSEASRIKLADQPTWSQVGHLLLCASARE